jgi:hypothetical protein
MTEHEMIHLVVPIAVGALILWRLQSRMRRMIGRQQLHPRRSWLAVLLWPLIVLVFALQVAMQAHATGLLGGSLAGGAALGIALGVIGLRLTRFEATSEGLYYTPSAHLGVALTVLLLARIGWRFLSGGVVFPEEGAPTPPPPALTPLTLLLFGTLAGYYATYAAGLLRWSSRSKGAVGQTQATADAPPQGPTP